VLAIIGVHSSAVSPNLIAPLGGGGGFLHGKKINDKQMKYGIT